MFMQELHFFITAAEQLSFTSASKLLFITQSGLSKQIDRLEKDLNVQLFERDHRCVKLTAAGEMFLALSKQFLLECNDLSTADCSAHSGTRRAVKVAVSPHYGHYATEYVRFFCQHMPEAVRSGLFVITITPDKMLNSLLNHQIDYALVSENALSRWGGVSHRIIMPRKRRVVVSSTHPLAGRSSVKISELSDERFLTISRAETPVTFDMLITICTSCGFYPKIVRQTDNFDTLYMLVGMGQGITISGVMPDSRVSPDTVALEIDESNYADCGSLNAINSDLAVVWDPEFTSLF